MRKLLLVGVILLTLLAGCRGQRAAEPTPTTMPTAAAAAQSPAASPATADLSPLAPPTTAALSPIATPTTVSAADTVAQSPLALPTTETIIEPTATGEPSAGSVVSATATIEAVAVAMPTPTDDLPTPSPECIPGALTPVQTEGPYYSQNPPEDATLYEEGMAGTPITLTGYVFDQNCEPLPGARVDFWQADAAGQYDNQGYTMRGYQLTDGEGRYAVTTVIPGVYPGRTRHIHVKVTAPDGPTLTSQLYFPDEPGNASDRIFNPATIVKVEGTTAGQIGFFNFVLDAR